MYPVRHNYLSDLYFVETFFKYDDQNELVEDVIPDYDVDFEFVYRAEDHRTFVAGRKNNVYFNCKPLNGSSIQVFIPLSRNPLGCGPLLHTLCVHAPNSDFLEGIQNTCIPKETGYILHKGASDAMTPDFIATGIAATILAGKSAYELAVKYGYEGTEEEFAKLQTETADELKRFEEETSANFGSQQKYIDTNIAVERNDRESGDASTLQAAKEYTDSTAASERVKSEAADRQTLTDAKAYIDKAINQVVNGSPAALDTLKELSDALGNDPNFAATITANLANKVDKIAGKGLSAEDFTTELKAKLVSIGDNANNYTHPSTHPASMITEDATRRFVTDSEKAYWNSKAPNTNATQSVAGLMSPTDKQKLDKIKSQDSLALNVLAYGKVNGTNSGASIRYKTFDNRALSVVRGGVGAYKITIPVSWGLSNNSYMVITTGYGKSYNKSYPIKATVNDTMSDSFWVNTSDDETPNDGSFFFMIIKPDGLSF